MGDSSTNYFELTEKNPSIYRIWQLARSKGGSEGEMEDRYRELLEEFGHRKDATGKW